MNKLAFYYAYTKPVEALEIWESHIGEFGSDSLEKRAFKWGEAWNDFYKTVQEKMQDPFYQRMALGLGGAALGGGLGALMGRGRGALLGAGLGGLGGWYLGPKAWEYLSKFKGETPASSETTPVTGVPEVVPPGVKPAGLPKPQPDQIVRGGYATDQFPPR